MRIGLLSISVTDEGKSGFYNRQDLGLAKGLSTYFEEVKVYRSVPLGKKVRDERVGGSKDISIRSLPAKNIGDNGGVDLASLDKDLDGLVCFSDTQLAVPKVYRWAVKNEIPFLPYIGAIESHSTNMVKKRIVDFLFRRNLAVYKKCHCLAKTEKIRIRLKELGVEHIITAPVGLDLSLVRQDHMQYDLFEIKAKYGYGKEDKVLLFIGRLVEEKQPIRMIDIFADVFRIDERYALLMVGSGSLRNAVIQRIKGYGLEDHVKMINRIPNRDIWELYRIADAFINLNQQEIFGMSILEAMYYGCKVIAWRAPGPEMIIEDGVSGWLVEDDRSVADHIIDDKDLGRKAHEHILKKFTWENTAGLIKRSVSENSGSVDFCGYAE